MRDHKAENASVTARVLRLLSDCEWHSYRELKKVTGGGRYSARLYDLELEGFEISRRESGKAKEYRLVSTVPGSPRHVRVKVFLEASDVRLLLTSGRLTKRAESVLRAAFARYEDSKSKKSP